MPIFYTDTASFNSLSVTGSTIMSASFNNEALKLIGNGSNIFSVTGSSGGLFAIIDASPSDANLFSVSSGSTTIFSIDQSKNVSISGSTIITGSLLVSNNTIITGSLTVFSGSSIELQVLNTGVRIGSLSTDIHTVTGSLRVSGSQSLTGS